MQEINSDCGLWRPHQAQQDVTWEAKYRYRPGALLGDQQQVVKQEEIDGLVELVCTCGPGVLRPRHVLQFTLLQQPAWMGDYRYWLQGAPEGMDKVRGEEGRGLGSWGSFQSLIFLLFFRYSFSYSWLHPLGEARKGSENWEIERTLISQMECPCSFKRQLESHGGCRCGGCVANGEGCIHRSIIYTSPFPKRLAQRMHLFFYRRKFGNLGTSSS